jgi:hypothetical protein
MFDLFQLHDSKYDVKSRGWIRLGGVSLIKELKKILLEITNNNISLNQISKLIAKDLKINHHTVYKYLEEIENEKWSSRENCIPLPILNSLLSFLPLKKYTKEKWKIIKLTKFLITGAPKSKKVKAIHYLTSELAKISGAHAADGTLAMANTGKDSKMYRWVVTDGDIYSLLALREWVKTAFGLNIEIKKSLYDNSFLFIVDSKVVLRYLQTFFNFKVGNKTFVVSIPEVIMKSSFKYKRNFALGVLTFDGSVDLDGNLRLNVKSKKLLESVANIMQKDGIKITFPKTSKKRGWTLKCKISGNKRALDYLDENSIKWKKAHGFLYGFDRNEAIKLFKETPISKITLSKFLETKNRLDTLDKRILAKNLNVDIRTIRKYTNLCKMFKT